MYKYKILLADDESEILAGISEILKNECEEIDIVACCNNGSQVLRYLQNNPVDIVISDISMPSVSGTEIAKYISEKNMSTKIILITGYRKFEYATDALRYKVFTFITKPINFDELIGSVERAKAEISAKNTAEISSSRSLLKTRDAERMNLIMFSSGLYEGVTENTFLNSDILKMPCALIEFKIGEKENFKNDSQTVWQHMCEIDDDEKNVFCIQENDFGATLLVFFKLCDITKITDSSEKYAESIVSIMKGAYSVSSSYKISSFATIRDISTRNFDSLAGLYVDYLTKNNFAAMTDFMKIIHSSFNTDMLRNFLTIVIQLVKSIGADTDELSVRVSSAHTKPELLSVLSDINADVKTDTGKSDNRIISIKNYISNHFNSNISLMSVATAFRLNPSYLSRIFKNSTGVRIGDYIIHVRMEKAKQLLSNKSQSVAEVAVSVGYNNTAYFGKIFKDYTGVTPAQYQNFGGEESESSGETKG